MPVAVGERRALVGHRPACPTASTPRGNLAGAGDLRGRVWVWIIVRWDTGLRLRESRCLVLLLGEQLA